MGQIDLFGKMPEIYLLRKLIVLAWVITLNVELFISFAYENCLSGIFTRIENHKHNSKKKLI